VKSLRPISAVASALFVIVIVFVMLGATSQTQSMPGMNMSGMDMTEMDMSGQLAELQGEEFEVAFMSMMIAHHRSATEMAQWILDRTENAEILKAAQTIIEDQEAEIGQMTGWLQEWYGREPDAEMMNMMASSMDSMMDTMMNAEDPERAFLAQMSIHHDSAIDMAQPALFQSTHGELRTLAQNIIVAQAEEIAQFQTWLTEL
jgi:uncharacterized protein (DUF305 family)